jgi:ABC-2 type transport system ATP-binding protein
MQGLPLVIKKKKLRTLMVKNELIEINGLLKVFNNKKALQNINFSIKSSEIVGLVGSNGSGKSTLLNIIAGIVKPTNGAIWKRPKLKLGMSVSRRGFFSDMSVNNNLLLYQSLIENFDSNHLNDFIRLMNIDFLDKRFGQLSAGMKQRVSLALAFMQNQDLILLDEPGNHLDVDSLISLKNLIVTKMKAGTSFLIASPVLTDLERVCDRLVFLKDGQIINSSSVEVLLEKYSTIEEAYLNIVKK